MSEKVKILYVDDEEPNLFLFRAQFRDKYEVITSESGSGGLEMLKEHPETSVVISDMKMPVMDGLQFIEKAKSIFPDKYYMILTGYAINDEIEEALQKGIIANYLQKPYNSEKVTQVVDELLT